MDLIIELLPVLLPLILECVRQDGVDGTRRNMRLAGPLVQLRLYRELKRHGYSNQQARERAAQCCRELRNATDADLQFLIDDAHDT